MTDVNKMLVEALREITADYADRFDLDSALVMS